MPVIVSLKVPPLPPALPLGMGIGMPVPLAMGLAVPLGATLGIALVLGATLGAVLALGNALGRMLAGVEGITLGATAGALAGVLAGVLADGELGLALTTGAELAPGVTLGLVLLAASSPQANTLRTNAQALLAPANRPIPAEL
jgi:hypothetical protein